MVAARHSPWEAILAGVNGGNDSDTIAMIAGAIAAAFGPPDLDAGVARQVEQVNSLALDVRRPARLAGVTNA